MLEPFVSVRCEGGEERVWGGGASPLSAVFICGQSGLGKKGRIVLKEKMPQERGRRGAKINVYGELLQAGGTVERSGLLSRARDAEQSGRAAVAPVAPVPPSSGTRRDARGARSPLCPRPVLGPGLWLLAGWVCPPLTPPLQPPPSARWRPWPKVAARAPAVLTTAVDWTAP